MTVHITFSVRWFATVAAFLALSINGLTSRDAQAVRTSYAAMELIARFVSFHWLSVTALWDWPVTGHSVGFVPALSGAGETLARHLPHHRSAGKDASDWLRRPRAVKVT
jgi:hypothetical protein